MAANSYDVVLYPSVILRVGAGQGLPATDLAERMIYFECHDVLKKADMVKIHLSDPDRIFVEDPRFVSDTPWSFRFGYPLDMSALRTMKLKYFEPEYDEGGQPSVLVTLMGNSCEMVRVKGAKNWGQTKTSVIAKKMAKKYGWTARVDDSNDAMDAPYVQSAKESDFEYMHKLAADIDFEFFVEGKVLYYRARDSAYQEQARNTLVYYGDEFPTILKSFKPTIKATKAAKVKARGTNTKTGAANNESVDNKNVTGTHLGDLPTQDSPIDTTSSEATATQTRVVDIGLHSGEHVTRDIASQPKLNVTKSEWEDLASEMFSTPEVDKKKTKRMANAKKRSFLDKSVIASAECIGSPRLRAKSTHIFILPDRQFTGKWYCTEAVHRIDGTHYTTSMKLHRGAYTKKKKGKKAEEAKKKADLAAASGTGAGGGGGGYEIVPSYVTNLETGETSKVTTVKGGPQTSFATGTFNDVTGPYSSATGVPYT